MKELKPLEWPFPKAIKIFSEQDRLKNDYEARKRVMCVHYKLAMCNLGVYLK